jgi:hypothetical protein
MGTLKMSVGLTGHVYYDLRDQIVVDLGISLFVSLFIND